MKKAFESKVLELRRETEKSVQNMELETMFASEDDNGELKFKDAIVGLQSHEEYKTKVSLYLQGHLNEENKIECINNINSCLVIGIFSQNYQRSLPWKICTWWGGYDNRNPDRS